MPDPIERPSRRLRLSRHGNLGLAGAALLALGGAAGAVVVAETRPSVSMAPATPVAIRSLSSSGIVTIRGRVTETYGNKFIMADGSGRALVDTGRDGDERQLVTPGQSVVVQGRSDRGFIHAAFLVGPDNKVTALGPLAGPPHGPRGPDRGLGAPPAPPPAAAADDVAAPPPPPPVGRNAAPAGVPAPSAPAPAGNTAAR